MAGPEPRDNYNPNQTVSPTTSAPNDTLSVRASGSDFGGQVAESVKGLGQSITQAVDKSLDYKTQVQGLANEHEANMADMQLAVQGGDVYNKYKQLEGLNASNAKDSAVSDYLATNDKIRSGLSNPAAQRAYDSIATRRMSFTIQDMNSYAADQQKKAYRDGNNDAMNLAVDQASKVDTASNDRQFGALVTGPIKFQANAMFTSPQYGKYRDIPATTNKDGTLSFDQSTDEGKIAQADYNNYIEKPIGQAWENRYKAMADDLTGKSGISDAAQMVIANKDAMPASTYAKLSAEASAPYKNEQTRVGADSVIARVDDDWNKTNSGQAKTSDLTGAFLQQESGNGKTSTNLGQIQPGTWAQFAKPGEDINNPTDNKAVTQRILNQYSSDYNGDTARMAVAYFSGPGNVAPVGSANPYINDLKDASGKSVSSYVSDIQNRVPSSGAPSAPDLNPSNSYVSRADYYRQNYDQIIEQSRQQAQKDHPGDATYEDQYAQRVEQRISNVIRTQELSVRADQDSLIDVIKNPKNPITDIGMLDQNPDPKIRDAWSNVQLNNAYGAENIRKMVTANTRGPATEYGSDFYKHLTETLSGKVQDPMSDPNMKILPGPHAPITNTGVLALTDINKNMNTPDGQAFAQAELGFLKSLHSQFTGAGQIPGVNDTQSNSEFDRALQEVLPKIKAGVSAGKSASDLFNPNSKDYITTGIAPPTSNKLWSIYADKVAAGTGTSGSTPGSTNTAPAAVTTFNNLNDLSKAVKANPKDRAYRVQAEQYAVSKGWIAPAAADIRSLNEQ